MKSRAYLLLNSLPSLKIVVVLLLSMPVLISCAGYTHRESYEVGFLQRARTYTQDNVEVTAVVLSADESADLFGALVAETGIQPVWIRIRNNDSVPYWLFSISIDPEYFSPYEAAWQNHFTFGAYSNVKMDSRFRSGEIHYLGLSGFPNEYLGG